MSNTLPISLITDEVAHARQLRYIRKRDYKAALRLALRTGDVGDVAYAAHLGARYKATVNGTALPWEERGVRRP